MLFVIKFSFKLFIYLFLFIFLEGTRDGVSKSGVVEFISPLSDSVVHSGAEAHINTLFIEGMEDGELAGGGGGAEDVSDDDGPDGSERVPDTHSPRGPPVVGEEGEVGTTVVGHDGGHVEGGSGGSSLVDGRSNRDTTTEHNVG